MEMFFKDSSINFFSAFLFFDLIEGSSSF